MPVARPRTVSLSPEENIKLAEEMLKWVDTHDCIHLKEFYCIEKGYTDNEWDTIHTRDEFFPYYERALAKIAMKYLREDTGIEPNVKNRWLRHYFKDLRTQEDKDKDDDVKRQKSLAETVQPEQLAQIQSFMALLESSRKSATNSNKSE